MIHRNVNGEVSLVDIVAIVSIASLSPISLYLLLFLFRLMLDGIVVCGGDISRSNRFLPRRKANPIFPHHSATSTTATATASATNTTTTTSTTPAAAANNNKLHHRTTSSTRSTPRHSDPRDTLTPSANLSSPPDPTTTAAIPNLPGKDEADRDRATNDPEQQSGAAEEEEEEEDSESISDDSSISSASMEEEESWISSFCNVIGHEYFAEVSEDFIEDDFNLTGLGAVVPM
jgi:hypothetical protein